MANTERPRRGFAIALFLVIIVMVILFVIWWINPQTVMTVFWWVFGIIFVLMILFVAAYVFWYLFLRKQKFDITYVNKMKLVDAGIKGCPSSIRKRRLILSGDKGHSQITWGTIVGYVRIQILSRNLALDEDKQPQTIKNPRTGELEPVYVVKQEEQDCFVCKKRAGLGGVFEEPTVVRVSPKDHDELIGDVMLYGFSLLPMSEYHFLNTDLLDVRKVDYAILKEAERGIMFESLRDMKEIVDKATGLDAPHQKQLEQKNLYDIPALGGGQQ